MRQTDIRRHSPHIRGTFRDHGQASSYNSQYSFLSTADPIRRATLYALVVDSCTDVPNTRPNFRIFPAERLRFSAIRGVSLPKKRPCMLKTWTGPFQFTLWNCISVIAVASFAEEEDCVASLAMVLDEELSSRGFEFPKSPCRRHKVFLETEAPEPRSFFPFLERIVPLLRMFQIR